MQQRNEILKNQINSWFIRKFKSIFILRGIINFYRLYPIGLGFEDENEFQPTLLVFYDGDNTDDCFSKTVRVD